MECRRCIMSDEHDPDIDFDGDGLCNHCRRYDELCSSRVFEGQDGQDRLDELIAKIKRTGKNKEYDCIIGVSGGVDSTYLAYLAKKLGLRPLAIHFDNGWNSNLAVKNIEKVLTKLEIDLHTYVIDWPEFKSLQLSFLHASVPDGEIPTDHAIDSLLWQEASKRKIKYILSGMNFATESLSVPSWAYGHSDWKYIKAIHKKFCGEKLKNFPYYTFFSLFYYNFIKNVRIVSILNYINYDKDEAMKVLNKELNWEYYGGKHYESIYTRFFQGYILPEKFNIDKRVGHLSDLINSGQISKEEAKNRLKEPVYPDKYFLEDYQYVLKKFDLSKDEFDNILKAEIKSFRDYPNSYNLVQFMRKCINVLRKYNLYPK
ncbi:N-acetyl sugar amidotransferase [Verrucomicrobia bacterium]|nr:N-acetyl sugar amidotransferase [Verrucomicrobiota bacterium]